MAVRFTPGTVLGFAVPGAGRAAYGLMLDTSGYMAFYEGGTEVAEDDARRALQAGGPLFVACMYRTAYSKGRWGEALLRVPKDTLPQIPPTFRQDAINPERLHLDDHLGNSRPAKPEEIVGLEATSVWDAEHVESRLADHYRGVPNAFVEQMRYKPVAGD